MTGKPNCALFVQAKIILHKDYGISPFLRIEALPLSNTFVKNHITTQKVNTNLHSENKLWYRITT